MVAKRIRKRGGQRGGDITYEPVVPVDARDTRNAALALIGAKLSSDPTLCGLEDVLDALAIRETLLQVPGVDLVDAETTEEEEDVVAPTKRGQYDWCAFCGTKTLALHTKRCLKCNRKVH